MGRLKNRIFNLFILIILPVLWANAQKKDLTYYQCAFFESYRAGNMSVWPKLIEEMEQVKSTDVAWQTEILNSIYGLVGFEVGQNNKQLASKYINKADDYLENLLAISPNSAQLHALAGAFYGYKISLAAYKAPFLGPKSLDHINKAIKLDPKEPMGYVVKGYSLSYRPPVFGGDKSEAMKCYRQALTLFEAQNDSKCNWQKMLLQAFMLKTFYETHHDKEAESFLAGMKKEYGELGWIEQFVGTEYFDKK